MAEQQVQITDLDPQQLQEVKKQLDEELDHLTSSYAQLKQAQSKFRSCIADIDELTPVTQNQLDRMDSELRGGKHKQVLVPLTSSLYVPGKLGDVSNVVVDVGTGYYVKKTRAEASAHYKGKADFVQNNLATLQKTIERKQENVQSVVQVMQMKLQEQQQQASA